MLKLIRLEWKKNNIMKYVWKAFVIVAVLLFMVLSLAAMGELEEETMPAQWDSTLKAFVELFTNMSFIVMTSAMLASFIVNSYKNKTIDLMFSYPISRKKIVLSQMLAVWIFNFTALVLSKVLIYAVLVMTKGYTHIAAEDIALGSGMFYIEIFVNSAVMVSISFIALLIGLKLRSSQVTVIAGFIIVCFTQGNIGTYTLIGNIPFHAALLVLSAAAVFLTLSKLETRDVN